MADRTYTATDAMKEACPRCGAAPGKKGWHRKDKSQNWGTEEHQIIGERWHCESCDNYHIFVEMAAEDHAPKRGSEVEAWIKANRDGYGDGTNGTSEDDAAWRALDSLLDAYRDMADTGYTLAEARAEST